MKDVTPSLPIAFLWLGISAIILLRSLEGFNIEPVFLGSPTFALGILFLLVGFQRTKKMRLKKNVFDKLSIVIGSYVIASAFLIFITWGISGG